MAITGTDLKQFLPLLNDSDVWATVLDEACQQCAIDTGERIAAFLAQIAYESAGFRRLEENLNYTAKGLMATWPKRFTSLQMASSFEHQPERIANFVYAGRIGNGPVSSGDGWRFRGRGLIQLTGRGNYREVGASLQLPLEADPDLAKHPPVAALCAAQFWRSHGLNELADNTEADDDDEDFESITVRINLGKLGLSERRALWKRARGVWAP
jgi:putative chitinase